VKSTNTLPELQNKTPRVIALRRALLVLRLTHKGLEKRYTSLYNSISLSRNSPSNATLFSNVMEVEIKM